MNKQENRDFLFSYCEINDNDEVQNLIGIELSPGEVRNI